MKHFNELSPAEHERLSLLMEECGEVIQAIGKIMRHGYDSNHPDSCDTNRMDLEIEISHVMAAIELLFKDVNHCRISTEIKIKLKNVKHYLHHQ